MVNSPPNVLLIVTDDQGYGDLGCMGNPYLRTPILDQLYANSMTLSDYHTEPMCSPTRSSLLTGMHSMRAGVWSTLNGRYYLRPDIKIISNYFQDSGYRTGLFGKWHMGDNYPYHPQNRGFDESLTFGGGVIGETPDHWNNRYFDDVYLHNGQSAQYHGYCTDIWFQEAMDFTKCCGDQPFFCYLPTNAPHDPYFVDPEYFEPYLVMGLPERLSRFYGMISCIDKNIGKMLQCLQEQYKLENTIIVFFGDNGSSGVQTDAQGHVLDGYNAGLRGKKGQVFEGGHRNNCIIHWEGSPYGAPKKINGLTSVMDLMPTLLSCCDIPYPDDLDGIDLTENFKTGKPVENRELIIHCMQLDTPKKYKDYTVLTDRWRLVKQDQTMMLFDFEHDPGETQNIAFQNPALVQHFLKDYEQWWEHIGDVRDDFSWILVGHPNEPETALTCHAWHDCDSLAYSQRHIRKGIEGSGFWPLEVCQEGTYRFELRRWCKDSSIGLRDAPPAEKGDARYDDLPEGQRSYIESSSITVQGHCEYALVSEQDESTVFVLPLKAGKTKLQTWFYCKDGKVFGAYYVYITRIDKEE